MKRLLNGLGLFCAHGYIATMSYVLITTWENTASDGVMVILIGFIAVLVFLLDCAVMDAFLHDGRKP